MLIVFRSQTWRESWFAFLERNFRVDLSMSGAVADCSSLTDVAAHNPPAIPSRPAFRQEYKDPTFGACVTRVTDAQTLGVNEAVHTYAELQAWNADQSLILLTTNQIIDAKTSQLVHRLDFGWPGTGTAVRWSPSDPLALYYTGELLSGSDGIACGVGKARLMRYRLIPGSPMRGQKELVHCFTEYSKFDKNASFQEMSSDGRYIALVSTDGQAFLYDLVANKKLATVSIPAWIEWAEPSPLGDYLLINFGGGGDGPQSGLEAYNPQTGAKVGKVATGHGHGSTALGPDGVQWYVYTTFDNYVGVAGPYIVKARIPKGYDDWKAGDKTGLVALVELDWNASLHTSCRTPRSEWCAVSTYAMTKTNVPFYQEVFRLSLNSTLQSPKVQRLAHHRSERNLPASCGMSNYWADPHASTSRDGTQIIFGSTWGQACRSEAYVIRLAGTAPPSPNNPADLNADGKVDVIDLGILLSAWGQTTKPKSDINQDGRVDVIDLGILLSKWGTA